jgi:THAP4-like, heme-binding beta-barrel domain
VNAPPVDAGVRGTFAAMATALHADIASLTFLLGTWRGEGTGGYPTIEPFRYREELVFEHVGDPFLLYRQESWSPAEEPVHFERGFLRPGAAAGSLELVLAHPIGVTEVAHGTLDGTTLELTATAAGIARAETGLPVEGLRRRYEVNGDELTYQLDMATADTPMTLHLEATLRRVA